MSLFSRIANVFSGERLHRELEEEYASHLEEAILAGRDPAEARRALGNSLRWREQGHDIRVAAWLDSLRADFMFGWRQLKRSRVTSAAAILSLALAIGAVVGATQPHTMQSLRKRLPRSVFLLPGYGAQGATAEMTRAAFMDGKGAVVSASRSILYAHRDAKYAQPFGNDWERCVEQAVLDMKQDLSRVLE